MKRTNLFSTHYKTIIIFALCLCIPFVSIGILVKYISEDIFYVKKGEKLMAIAEMLDIYLVDGGYDEILAEAGVTNGTREQKIAVLNKALSEITDEAANVSEGLGVGFYSLELDAVLTYGPSYEYGNNIGTPIAADHPGRQVMASNTPMIKMGTMLRGEIMNAMYPVVRKEKVIGYIWSNELVSDLEMSLKTTSNIILLLLILSYVFMLALSMFFLRKFLKTEQKSHAEVEEALKETKYLNKLINIGNDSVTSLLMIDSDSFEKTLYNCMKTLAQAFDAESIYIWDLRRDDGDNTQKYFLSSQWFRQAEKREKEDLSENKTLSIAQVESLNCTHTALLGNQIVRLNSNNLSEEEQSYLSSHGIFSVIAFPVFIQEEFWGFVAFGSGNSKRTMTKDEESVDRKSVV